MALLLTPYNEAMRIGMGFNSYTQQLCVNDVVRRPGGGRASDKDLRSVDPSKGLPSSGSGKQRELLSEGSGVISKKGGDGQSDVSQVVSWEAGFVDKVSDVSKSLNIGGALQISVAALGGAGGGASGHYLDESKFVNSDANYNITVKVTNMKLVADDVTEFTPIPYVPETKFNEVYGDCYISGFIEGGVLSAVVSKTIEEKTLKKDFGGELKVNIPLSAVTVSGEAKGGKVDTEKQLNTNTKIQVSWSGGGDIKPDSIKEWDIPSLMQVAMEFPDKVAACPQRTFAILTKYTSLRSFHEQTVKGSPLDYEIAGIYTNALLDSYMEYKAMWADLLQTIKDVDQGVSKVKTRQSSEKLLEYGKLIGADYDTRMVRFDAAKTALANSASADQVVLQEPLLANKVIPYEADAFGLDKAQRDCRFEMIKIVREVNEVTYDPKVAVQTDRNYRYLAPSVFRMLLPTDKQRLPTPEEIEEEKRKLQKEIDDAKEEARRYMDYNKTLSDEKDDLRKQLSTQAEEHKRKSDDDTQQRAAADAETSVKRDTLEKDLREKLEQAQEEKQKLEGRLKDLEKTSEEYKQQQSRDQASLESTKNDLQTARNESNSWKEKADSKENQVQEEQRKLNSYANWSAYGQDIVVLSVTWGNSSYSGWHAIEEKIVQYAQNNWGFTWNNEFFLGQDGLPGQRKYGVIVYQKKGQRPIRVQGWEHESAAFTSDGFPG